MRLPRVVRGIASASCADPPRPPHRSHRRLRPPRLPFVPTAEQLDHVRRYPNALAFERNRPLVRVFAWIGPYDVARLRALLAHPLAFAFGGRTRGALLRTVIQHGIIVTEERAADWRSK